jgi:hypothetical protein
MSIGQTQAVCRSNPPSLGNAAQDSVRHYFLFKTPQNQQALNIVLVRIRKTVTDATGEMTATAIVSDNTQTAMPVQDPQTPGTGYIVRATNTGGDRADRVVGAAAGYEYWPAGGGMQK